MKTLIAIALVALSGTSAIAAATPSRVGGIGSPFEDTADSLFQVGRQAINDEKYEQAATVLRQLVDRYPTSSRAGEAMYWRAWAQYQLGMDRHNKSYFDAALASIDQLQAKFPKSSSVADARDLRTRILSAQAGMGDARAAGQITTKAKELKQSGTCSSGDDEMRMAALQGLMSVNSDDALPILKQVLAQRDPCRVELRKQAVYMISQRRGDDVTSALLDVARNDPNGDVKGSAIYWLSTQHSDRAAAALDSILTQGRDDDLRIASVYALSQVGTDNAIKALRRAVQDEKTPDEIRGNAIYWLGRSKGGDLAFFRTVFQSTKSTEVRQAIASAVMELKTPAATQWLIDIAKDKSIDSDSRKNAIYWVSRDRTTSVEQISTIYNGARGDDDVQNQVIYALSGRNESAAVDKLMAIAKSDPNIEMRKTALYWLGKKDDPRIKQFIRDLIMK